MTDEVLSRLVKIRKEFEAILRAEGVLPEKSIDVLLRIGMTRRETKAWSKEPDFTKRIATALPTKRRRRVT